ncbi:retroviral-like aspartic protease 1 [Psammomys obesus]|uniref:retroviral-like aspartic protease 1 n=1 Tax=Psammomys obesus TaxID=48139 RepID=UPI00245302A7|nr:retroviral-like aspartic protease 1 [Psammomys obesus]
MASEQGPEHWDPSTLPISEQRRTRSPGGPGWASKRLCRASRTQTTHFCAQQPARHPVPALFNLPRPGRNTALPTETSRSSVIAPTLLCAVLYLACVTAELPEVSRRMATSGARSKEGHREHAFIPEPFNGANIDASLWLHRFEVIDDLNHWDHATKLRFLKESLRGDALDVYNGLNPQAQGDYSLVKEALLTAFVGLGAAHSQKPKEIVFANSMGKGYYLKGKIGHVPVKFLVDSGAQVSVVHPSLWEEVTDGDLDTLKPFDSVVKVANGATMKILGVWNTELTLGKMKLKAAFLVANASAEEAIIGTDVLQDHNAVLDFEHRTCTLKGKKFRLLPVGGSLEDEFDLEFIEEEPSAPEGSH